MAFGRSVIARPACSSSAHFVPRFASASSSASLRPCNALPSAICPLSKESFFMGALAQKLSTTKPKRRKNDEKTTRRPEQPHEPGRHPRRRRRLRTDLHASNVQKPCHRGSGLVRQPHRHYT